MLSRSVVSKFCDPMDCSPSGSFVHGILQARILKWVAMPASRGSSWPRDRTCISCVSCTAGSYLPAEPLGKPINGNEIFCNLFFLLNTMFLRFIHLDTCISSSFTFNEWCYNSEYEVGTIFLSNSTVFPTVILWALGQGVYFCIRTYTPHTSLQKNRIIYAKH